MVSLRQSVPDRCVALAAVLYGVPAVAQAADGRITGVVRDATGAGAARGHRHDHQPGDAAPRQTATVVRRRQPTRSPCRPASYTVTVVAEGLRPADAQGRGGRRAAPPPPRTSRWSPARGGGHGHRHAARADRAGRALLRRGADRGRAARARRRQTSRAWPPTWPASPCRTSAPARARWRCAASPPARSCATSRASRSRSASTSTTRSSRSRCSRRTSTCSTSAASRCCAGRRARCSAPARSPAPCATSATSRSSA